MQSLRVGCKRKESIDRKWFAAHELHATHLLHNQSISRSSIPPAYVYFRAACTTMLHVTAFTAQPTVKQRKLKSFCSHNTAYALPAWCTTWNVSILKLLHSYFASSMRCLEMERTVFQYNTVKAFIPRYFVFKIKFYRKVMTKIKNLTAKSRLFLILQLLPNSCRERKK